MIARQGRLLLVAIQFLTRIPVPQVRDFDPAMLTRAARWFAVVGQGVGAAGAAVLLLASAVWPPWIAALLALGAGVLVTGAFHEDGLADTADGLGGGQTPQRRLEIMRDSRVGTYGVLALGLCLALKAASLAALSPLAGALGLIAAHGFGRAAAVVAMRVTPYADLAAAGKWKPTPRGVTTGEVVAACLTAAWPLLFLGPGGFVGVVVGATLPGLVLFAAIRLIGGHTGDVLGGAEQAGELGFLLGLAAFAA